MIKWNYISNHILLWIAVIKESFTKGMWAARFEILVLNFATPQSVIWCSVKFLRRIKNQKDALLVDWNDT